MWFRQIRANKKKIKINNKKYFHFPLGGILTKTTIFKKLEILLKDIEIEIKKIIKNSKI